MPYAITCPMCRHPLMVSESPVDYVATCPTCHRQLTVQAVAIPPAPVVVTYAAPAPSQEEFEPEPTSERRRRRSSNERVPVWVPAAFVVLIVAVVAAVGWAVMANKGSPKVEAGAEPADSKTKDRKDLTTQQVAPTPKQFPDAAIQRVKKATVLVRVEFQNGKAGSGTGFFIPGSGRVITNSHVIGPRAKTIEVVIESGTPRTKTRQATVLADDPDRDLALLEIPPGDAPESLVIGDTSGLKETHEVYIFGFPLGEQLGSEITVNKSAVSSLRRGTGGPEIQMNGGVNPGNSGGPVIDTSGKVVGVVVAKVRGTEISFAIPAETVKEFMRSAR